MTTVLYNQPSYAGFVSLLGVDAVAGSPIILTLVGARFINEIHIDRVVAETIRVRRNIPPAV